MSFAWTLLFLSTCCNVFISPDLRLEKCSQESKIWFLVTTLLLPMREKLGDWVSPQVDSHSAKCWELKRCGLSLWGEFRKMLAHDQLPACHSLCSRSQQRARQKFWSIRGKGDFCTQFIHSIWWLLVCKTLHFMFLWCINVMSKLIPVIITTV